ncbi:MAG TPA: hypothetical protein EYP68_03125, partial [Candidatus Korarchaeota archaeon]|nr:hypothetical protein [Candidatus Korarchaeota archaeon]
MTISEALPNNSSTPRLGSSRSLVVELDQRGLFRSFISYLTPPALLKEEKCVKAFVTEELNIGRGLELTKLDGPRYEPVTSLVEEGVLPEKWAQELADKAPFPVRKGMTACVVSCSWNVGGNELKRIIRAIPGVEMGTIAMEVSFSLPEEIESFEWEIQLEEGKGMHLIVRQGGTVEAGTRLSLRVTRKDPSFKLYVISVPPNSNIDRRMVLIPKGGANERENLRLCACEILRSLKEGDRRRYMPIVIYDEELEGKNLEIDVIRRFFRRIMPDEVLISLIGVDDSLKGRVEAFLGNVLGEIRGISPIFLRSEEDIEARINGYRCASPLEEVIKLAEDSAKDAEGLVLIDARSQNGIDQIARLLGYEYAALRRFRVIDISNREYEELEGILRHVRAIGSLIDLAATGSLHKERLRDLKDLKAYFDGLDELTKLNYKTRLQTFSLRNDLEDLISELEKECD